jgi:hypothetical protein
VRTIRFVYAKPGVNCLEVHLQRVGMLDAADEVNLLGRAADLGATVC